MTPDTKEAVVKNFDYKIILRILKYTKPHWKGAVLAVLGLLLATVAELMAPIILQRTLDEHILGESGSLAGIQANSLIYLFLHFGVLLFTFVQVYQMAGTGQKVMKDIRLDLIRHTIGQNLDFLGKTPVGGLVSRITSDVETINEFYTSVAISLLKDGALMIGVIIALFYLDVEMAVITTLTLPPVLILVGIFRAKARNAYRLVQEGISKVNTFLSEHISGMKIVQIFGRELLSNREFNKKNKELLKANIKEMYVYAIFRPLIQLLTSVSIGAALYFGTGLHNRGLVTLGVLIAFINLIDKFYMPVQDIAEKFTLMQSAMAGGERVFALLDNKKVITDEGKAPLGTLKQGIKFSQVHFSYKKDEPIIKNLSFEVNRGETVAVVGYTGAGKTTIANLITRLWDIHSGSITLDGRDIRDFPLEELRRTIQPVQQDVFLFAGTIRENITLGYPMDEEKIRQAAQMVEAHSFIQALPEGYDTILAEGGVNLSAGQRQLLSFARIIAHDPSMIILDEATASIDTETEKLIQHALKNLLSNRTSLVIAHRISTIREADQILVLNAGQLAESGTHQELIERGGVYSNLYKLQYEAEGV